jgi:hypothetical protein
VTLTGHELRTLGRSVRSQSLYRLRNPGSFRVWGVPGSNLSSKTGLSEVPRGFPQSLKSNSGTVAQMTK